VLAYFTRHVTRMLRPVSYSPIETPPGYIRQRHIQSYACIQLTGSLSAYCVLLSHHLQHAQLLLSNAVYSDYRLGWRLAFLLPPSSTETMSQAVIDSVTNPHRVSEIQKERSRGARWIHHANARMANAMHALTTQHVSCGKRKRAGGFVHNRHATLR
jgi:hypothetical protein